VQVDALGHEHALNFLERHGLAVEVVGGGGRLVGRARDDKVAVRHDGVVVRVRRVVDDLVKVDGDAALLQVGVLARRVDELRQLLEADLRRALAEDEEERVNHVALARAVGPHHRRERLVERADLNDACAKGRRRVERERRRREVYELCASLAVAQRAQGAGGGPTVIVGGGAAEEGVERGRKPDTKHAPAYDLKFSSTMRLIMSRGLPLCAFASAAGALW
jgi:hypothetical protein